MSKTPATKKPSKNTTKKPARKPALGRGLSALMDDVAPATSSSTTPHAPTRQGVDAADTHSARQSRGMPKRGIESVAVDLLMRNPDQPRRHFDKQKLDDLTRSVRDKGVLQPILVRPVTTKAGRDGYQIVAGERRWLAAQAAGLERIPVLVRELSDQEILEIGVVENVQRADLNPIEEALAYQALIEQFDRKHGEIAEAIGKSRAHVTNTLRLLALPAIAREHLAAGRISAGHARAILSSPDAKGLTEAILRDDLSVRAAERWSKLAQQDKTAPAPEEPTQTDADTRALEQDLSDILGLKTRLNHKSPGGTVTVRYKSLEQLDELIRRLKQSG